MTESSQTSKQFGLAQSLILCIFAAAYFADRGAWLFTSAAASTVGLVLSAIGLAIMAAAIIALRQVIQIAPEPKEGGHLVTRGIYGWLRHPIYTAILLVVIGLFLRKPTLLVAIAGAVVIVFLFIKVRLEERLLLERYPDYAGYRRRTWGLVPGLR